MENNLFEWAQKYRAIGWNVIPLYNYSKNPAPLRWKEYEDRMATDQEIENWFKVQTPTGLGLVTGRISGIVVLDEDAYKEGGVKVAIKTGMLSETARKGKHHFFKYVEPIRSSGLRKGIYVEIKADGGFIVLPPSQVRFDDGTVGEYSWIDKCYPEALPPILESQLAPFRADVEDGKVINVMELTGASLGTQHNNLRSICLSLFARFKKDEWALAEEIIRQKAKEFDPPHPEQRVLKMIKDTKQFILTHNAKEVDAEIKAEPSLPSYVNDLVAERIADRALEAIAPKTGWPELDRLIKGFVPGHIYTFTGDTNVGKTTIACNFSEALRQQKKKVLYIALEPDVNVVEYLASVRHKKPFEEVTDEELYVTDADGEKTDDGYVQIYLQRDIRTVDDLIRSLEDIPHFDLIIIDHIGYFVRSDRDWIQQQSNVIKQLAFLAKSHKTAVMMIAHLRKPDNKKKDWVPNQNDIAGSASFKQDSTEVLIAFRPTKETDQYSIEFSDRGVILVTKTKCGPNGAVPLFFESKSAKVYSEEEATSTPQGQAFLQQHHHTAYQAGMQASNVWMEKEVDTGNDD